MQDMTALYDAILNGDRTVSETLTREALAAGIDPSDLVTKYMIPAMDEVGRRFQAGEFFVPEMLLAARAMKSALAQVRPLLVASGAKPAGVVVIGTVKGDLHDIGKNLVAAMLEGGGFTVTDLGTDVDPARFVEEVESKKADLVCLSALLTVTMPAMKNAIETLKRAGIRDRIKVLIGGAPVTAQYAREIGADGYSEDAAGAVSVARQLVGAANGG